MLIPCVVARPSIGPDSQSLAFDLILPPCTQQEGEKSFRLLQESNWLASMHAIHYPFTSKAFMSKWVTRDWKNLSCLPEARMERFQQGMSFSAFLIFWCWFSFVIFSGNCCCCVLFSLPRPCSSVGRAFERSQSGATLPWVWIPVAALELGGL